MPAFIVVDLIPRNADKLAEYSAGAAQTLIPYNGTFIAKGRIHALNGTSSFENKVIIQFPGRDSALAWYASSAYQQLIPLRDQGMDCQFHLID